MKLVNLTSHAITIYGAHGEILTIAPSGMLARVKYTYSPNGFYICDGVKIPMVKQHFKAIVDIPPELPDTLNIVSWMALEASKLYLRRNDLVSPHSSNRAVIRDSWGDIIGVRALRT